MTPDRIIGEKGRVILQLATITILVGLAAALFHEARIVAIREAEDKAEIQSDIRYTRMLVSMLASEAVIAIDSDGKVIIFNPSAEYLLGYNAADVIDKDFHALVPVNYRDKHRADFKAMIDQLKAGHAGELKRIQNRKIPILKGDGTEERFHVVLRTSEVDVAKAKDILIVLVIRKLNDEGKVMMSRPPIRVGPMP